MRSNRPSPSKRVCSHIVSVCCAYQQRNLFRVGLATPERSEIHTCTKTAVQFRFQADQVQPVGRKDRRLGLTLLVRVRPKSEEAGTSPYLPVLQAEFKAEKGDDQRSAFGQSVEAMPHPPLYLHLPNDPNRHPYQLILTVKGSKAQFFVRHLASAFQMTDDPLHRTQYDPLHPKQYGGFAGAPTRLYPYPRCDLSDLTECRQMTKTVAETITKLLQPEWLPILSQSQSKPFTVCSSSSTTTIYPSTLPLSTPPLPTLPSSPPPKSGAVIKTIISPTHHFANTKLELWQTLVDSRHVEPYYPLLKLSGPHPSHHPNNRKSASSINSSLKSYNPSNQSTASSQTTQPTDPLHYHSFTVALAYVQGQILGKSPSLDHFDHFIPAVTALLDLHAQGLAHNDARSPNVVLTPSKEIKFIDFEYAFFYSHLSQLFNPADPLTKILLLNQLSTLGTYYEFFSFLSLPIIYPSLNPKSDPKIVPPSQAIQTVAQAQADIVSRLSLLNLDQLFCTMQFVDLWSVFTIFSDRGNYFPEVFQKTYRSTIQSWKGNSDQHLEQPIASFIKSYNLRNIPQSKEIWEKIEELKNNFLPSSTPDTPQPKKKRKLEKQSSSSASFSPAPTQSLTKSESQSKSKPTAMDSALLTAKKSSTNRQTAPGTATTNTKPTPSEPTPTATQQRPQIAKPKQTNIIAMTKKNENKTKNNNNTHADGLKGNNVAEGRSLFEIEFDDDSDSDSQFVTAYPVEDSSNSSDDDTTAAVTKKSKTFVEKMKCRDEPHKRLFAQHNSGKVMIARSSDGKSPLGTASLTKTKTNSSARFGGVLSPNGTVLSPAPSTLSTKHLSHSSAASSHSNKAMEKQVVLSQNVVKVKRIQPLEKDNDSKSSLPLQSTKSTRSNHSERGAAFNSIRGHNVQNTTTTSTTQPQGPTKRTSAHLLDFDNGFLGSQKKKPKNHTTMADNLKTSAAGSGNSKTLLGSLKSLGPQRK